MCLSRPQKLCNFLEWREYKIVYKRYASLFFITCVDKTDNELITLEVIHQFVEVLDRYFGNVVNVYDNSYSMFFYSSYDISYGSV